MRKAIKKFFWPILKYFQDVKNIEALKKEEYTKGCTDTAIQFSENARKQNEYINRIISDNMLKIQELESSNLKVAEEIRQTYIDRIKDLEKRYNDSCTACKNVTDEERKRIKRLQEALAEKLHESDEIFRRLYNHATMISDEHTSIMQSTARAIASKNELGKIKDEMDNVSKKSNQYLLAELSKDENVTTTTTSFKVEEAIEEKKEV